MGIAAIQNIIKLQDPYTDRIEEDIEDIEMNKCPRFGTEMRRKAGQTPTSERNLDPNADANDPTMAGPRRIARVGLSSSLPSVQHHLMIPRFTRTGTHRAEQEPHRGPLRCLPPRHRFRISPSAPPPLTPLAPFSPLLPFSPLSRRPFHLFTLPCDVGRDN